MDTALTPLDALASVFLQGFALGLGLIVAIGAQNAFVLRQGLRREHVGAVVLFCALADALLIAAGVFGMAQAAAFTLLNPHVYLDTVLLVGSIGAQQEAPLQPWFVLGASTASALWFGALGLGARWLAPWFAKPRAWQVLDALIGLTMWLLAALLVRHAWGGA